MFDSCGEAAEFAALLQVPDIIAIRATLCSIRPELAVRSETLGAATLLLVGPGLNFNIDRMAGRTGAPRPFVAACTRRLFDNGVWEPGSAVYTWSSPDDDAFWRDAAVAEGQLCRRRDSLGQIEWAEPGEWKKHYDFDTKGADSIAVRYVCNTDHPAPDGPVEEDRIEKLPTRRKSVFGRATVRSLGRARAKIDELTTLENTDSELVLTNTANERPQAVELFPDAKWL